jgi:hypothetical protein
MNCDADMLMPKMKIYSSHIGLCTPTMLNHKYDGNPVEGKFRMVKKYLFFGYQMIGNEFTGTLYQGNVY